MALNLLKKALLYDPKAVRNVAAIYRNAFRNRRYVIIFTDWNYQYKPGPYPKTPEERAAAAKKYGLTIEEYQPYPEDMGYGDYPKLPDIGTDSKDPTYPYDLPDLKRNFNEPFHARAEIFGEDRYDPAAKRRFSLTHQWTWFLGTIFGSLTLYMWLENYKFGRPVTLKQYPNEGPHYLFCAK